MLGNLQGKNVRVLLACLGEGRFSLYEKALPLIHLIFF